ncbi:MAG: hypothetical protein RDV48_03710 [Candidatus Eremiobacteraeota bacterium]|nr:hypothetical protein [Candidatus Eremiobacteraeota bacterium]
MSIKMVIYPLLKSSRGYHPAEFEVAEVTLSEGELVIHCPDGALREKIAEIFSMPLRVRRSEGPIPHIFSHGYEEVAPRTERFLREMSCRLRAFNLHGVLKGGLAEARQSRGPLA